MIKGPESRSDANLLILVSDGDVAAFKVLIKRYHGSFMAMAVANSLSHADCEEAVGDAFLKIWNSAAKYEDVGIDPKYWLRTLMRHALLDKLRAQKRFNLEQSASAIDNQGDFISDDYGESAETTSAVFATPIDALETKQADACFDSCLKSLSDAHRDTLQRSLIAGQTESFIATETSQSLGTVKSRKHYAVKKMQACVSDCLAGNPAGAQAAIKS